MPLAYIQQPVFGYNKKLLCIVYAIQYHIVLNVFLNTALLRGNKFMSIILHGSILVTHPENLCQCYLK